MTTPSARVIFKLQPDMLVILATRSTGAGCITGSQYADLHGALATKGITLVIGPDAYTAAHHLPESFGAIKDRSPASAWFTQPTDRPLDTDAFRGALSTIGPGPAMIKDWVKSRKHEWEEACFMPESLSTTVAGPQWCRCRRSS